MFNTIDLKKFQDSILSDISLKKDLKKLTEKILQLSIEQLNADSGSIFLIEDRKIIFQILAYQSSFAKVIDYKMKEAMTKGLAGWAYQKRQGALCVDTENDERWLHFGDEGDEIQSAIAVPFVYFDEIIAMMTLHHKEKRFFNEVKLAQSTLITESLTSIIEAVKLANK